MKLTATCATCGKPFKSVHLTLPVIIPAPPHQIIATLNNCAKCGARGVYLAEFKDAPQDAA